MEQEELKKLKQEKLFAKRRKQKKKQMMSQLEKNPVAGASQQFPSSEDSQSSYEFSDGSDIDDEEEAVINEDGLRAGYPLPDDLDNSQEVNAHISNFIDIMIFRC